MLFLYGAYGTGNLGDDAILKAALEIHGRNNCKVVSYGSPFLRQEVDYIDHFAFIDNPKEFLSPGDTLIFAGGGLFWTASHAAVMRRCAESAREIGCDVQVERLGAQGVHAAIDDAKILFSLCSRISVRDHFSVDLLKQLNVTDRAIYEPDFVLELRDKPAKKFNKERIVVGISHSAVPFYYDEAHRRKTLHIYNLIVERCFGYCDFVYIPHTRHFNVIAQNDVIYGEYFWQASRGRIQSLPFPSTVEELLEYYAGVDVVFAWRYHALVLAKVMGAAAAFLGQPGGHKYSAFAKEHQLPQINFDLEPIEVAASAVRLINRVSKKREQVGVTAS
ncbi:polysaccharide pyruvyl transferase family protein [Devosia nitrariae]|uniref:Polysaccharide pyruvyl transferase domain-containing protein n=1 Tax=Devosia nitrariae TaxID=2071872 RepID=A0ABQ5W534_9HYPH|nr:polysaccharide pyruvyl transferase family protein [Devosia nitrariae]GLQ54967.1 hypothetical protein GCM10010862_22260 [Devosia nitrariae]